MTIRRADSLSTPAVGAQPKAEPSKPTNTAPTNIAPTNIAPTNTATPAKPTTFAPAAAPATNKGTTGMEAAKAPTRPGQLNGIAPSAPQSTSTLSVAQAFDNLKAPGGPTQARLLSDGADAWNARMDIIENAKTSIDATYFIMEKDPYGYAFLGGLLKKQLEGVKVRVSTDAMADTFGKNGFKAPTKGQDYLQEIVNHGGEAYIYHPVLERGLDFLKGEYAPLASNHDKILVADGKRGITGGRNIAQDYFASPKDIKGAWRDMDIALEGAGAAAGLQEAFEAELHNGGASKPVKKDLLGNWSKKDIQLLGSYEMMQAWLKDAPLTEAEKTALRASPEGKAKLAGELVERALAKVQADLPPNLKRAPNENDKEFLHDLSLRLVENLEARGSRRSFDAGTQATHETETKIIDQTSAATGNRVNNMAGALAALAEGATKRLIIENPYVVLTKEMMTVLQRASERGVAIDIITNSPLSTDSDVTQAFFLEDWQMILAKCPTARIFVATGDRKFHTKSAVIDDDKAVVSTYNLDLLSGYVNGEVGAVVKSKEVAQDLTLAFEADKADPNNGFIEYTIEKDANGKAVLRDGKPVRKFGPEDHLPKEILETYASKRNTWGNLIRQNIPQFKPLRHE